MLIGYMRVSSDSDRQTTDLQRDALLAAGVDERHLFQDKASGARDDRPGLAQALAFLRPGDVLVVWKLDRLGRSLPHLIEIVNGLKTAGVGFRSLTEQMDTATPHGELLFHLFGALAQYERALTQERIKAGLAPCAPPAVIACTKRKSPAPAATAPNWRDCSTISAREMSSWPLAWIAWPARPAICSTSRRASTAPAPACGRWPSRGPTRPRPPARWF